MKILAIDTSSKICSVSILENDDVILEKHTNDEKTHSQNLMPLVDGIFKESNLSLDDIDLLSCCLGPGSFTGIRIGIATVKAFADVKNIPVAGVTSLESLAYNIDEPGLIISLIDAKNDNVYYSLFSFDGNNYNQIGEYKADNIQNILDYLSIYDDPLLFVGDGSILHQDKIQTYIKNPKFASEKQNIQTSISIGKSAYNKYKSGNYGDSSTILPIYLKKSQAERQLDGEK